MKNKKCTMIIAVIFFLIGLYFTEISPFSANEVATYNGGYGTFDMKKYDIQSYKEVMNATTDFTIYWKYYMGDFIFIATFLNLMVQVIRGIHSDHFKKVKVAAYIFAIARGLVDLLENCMLMYLIYGYPNVKSNLITVCNAITQMKFAFLIGWILCFVLLEVLHQIEKRKIDRDVSIRN